VTAINPNMDLFKLPAQSEAAALRDAGILMAVEHADQVEPDWSTLAYDALKQYLRISRGTFMTEEVRSYAKAIGVPTPPSLRSWGAIMTRASKEKLIRHVGFGTTNNPKAHKTPASLWVRYE
jgi:hypothetical protein